MSKDTAAIRDQLGQDPDIIGVLNANWWEELGIEEQSTRAFTMTLGNSWIVGSSTNGIVGTNTATMGGGQQVVGEDGRVTTLQRVVNPNKRYNEHFRDEDFKSTPFTADWNTTSYRLACNTATSHAAAYNTVATSGRIAYNDGEVARAVITSDETKYGGDIIKYFLTNDGGTTWKEFTKGVEGIFTGLGNEDLRFRIVFLGNGGASTYVENVRVSYSDT